MHQYRTAIPAMALLVLLAAPAFAADWRGDVYPDRSNLNQSRFIGTFDSLDACREAALDALRQLGASDSGDYECGKNCKPLFPQLADSVQVCEETRR